tara:strand:- start:23 stop:274 length:252 start_codon:yes stop_codon:yes gene_type:complete
MALTERTQIGSCEVLSDGQIQVRTDTIIEKDGEEISRSFHRHVIVPGADVSGEDATVQKVANTIHTAEVITEFREAHVPEEFR